MRIYAIDGANRLDVPVTMAECLVEEPSTNARLIKKRTPGGKLSKTKKTGEQKYVKAFPAKEWDVTQGLTILEILDLPKLQGSGVEVRIEPNVGSYPDGSGKDVVISLARKNRVNLVECDSGLSLRGRKKFNISKQYKNDANDAMLIAMGNPTSFSKPKMLNEKIVMDRTAVKELLEKCENAEWVDEFSSVALKSLPIKEISKQFGSDLAQPVFLVTAYAAAKDPQCKTRKDFERFCGLAARFRSGGNIGIGSIISSNLTHHNDSPHNKKAARFIYYLVKRASQPLT